MSRDRPTATLAAWVAGSRDFMDSWWQPLVENLGISFADSGSLALAGQELDGRSWCLPSMRDALDQHDWLLQKAARACPGTGVVIMAGWKNTPKALEEQGNFWQVVVWSVAGKVQVRPLGFHDTWALLVGISVSNQSELTAVQVLTERALKNVDKRAWKATWQQENLEKALSPAALPPRVRSSRL